MFCLKCGKEIVEGISFCQYCGNPVNATKPPVQDSIKNTAESLFHSFQEKAKNVGESFNTINEETQKEKRTQSESPIPDTAQKQVKEQTENLSKRFKVKKFATGFFSYYGAVIVDRYTGVNYLFTYLSDAGGLTVLLDENGKPLITKEDRIKTEETEEN